MLDELESLADDPAVETALQQGARQLLAAAAAQLEQFERVVQLFQRCAAASQARGAAREVALAVANEAAVWALIAEQAGQVGGDAECRSAAALLYEDPHSPRTVFPEESIAELAEDIRQRGVLRALVVRPADSDGRRQVPFGAKRLRAAVRAGLDQVPVVVRDLPADRHAQVTENQKRHGLTPLKLVRFIRAQVDAGDSNATIARQLGMNLTAVAHHQSLLDLPPVLDDALKSGRCTSPRTLHELSKLHADRPDQVQTLRAGEADSLRASMSAIRSATDEPVPNGPAVSPPNKLIAQAIAACDRLERALSRVKPPDASPAAAPALIALRGRVEGLATRWLQGSDRQTPSQAER